MKHLALLLVIATSAATAGLPSPGEAGAIDDSRYCGELDWLLGQTQSCTGSVYIGRFEYRHHKILMERATT